MKPRVLVVDDDSALAEMLGIVLRADGFDPAFVPDGNRAVTAFRESKPDIVLLDLMLPGLSGLDVCRAIRAESGVPIIMLTAKSDTVDVVLGLESGADDYVVKPFKPKDLVRGASGRIGLARGRRGLFNHGGPALYPTPRTVKTISGFSGSRSTLERRRCTWTLTSRVSAACR